MQFVENRPGATIQQVADGLGIAHTTATYHLRVLDRLGAIERRRHGRTVRHFCQGSHDTEARLAPILRDRKRAKVLEHLKAADSRHHSINGLAKKLGLTFGVTKSTLMELSGMGLVTVESVHGRYRVVPRAALFRMDSKIAAGGPDAPPWRPDPGLVPHEAW